MGSSPRMRGTLCAYDAGDNAQGIIPAYAGNTRRVVCLYALRGDHPRVCGEHPPYDPTGCAAWGSSPRMRGTPSDVVLD